MICVFKTGLKMNEIDYDHILSQAKFKKILPQENKANLLFLHKAINGNIDVPEILHLIKLNVIPRRTHNSKALSIPYAFTVYTR